MQSGVHAGNGYAKITRLDYDKSNLDTARQALENQLQTAGLDARVTFVVSNPSLTYKAYINGESCRLKHRAASK